MIRVWTLPNERLAQVCILEHDRFFREFNHGEGRQKRPCEEGPVDTSLKPVH